MWKLDSKLHLELFGSPEVKLGEKKVTGFITVKSRALLYYLTMKPGVHSRQTLAALLWPETTEVKAAKNLRNILSNLRKLVGSHLDITRTTVAFKRDAPYFLDVEQFSALLERYRRGQKDISDLETAVALYTGEFLEGFYVPDSTEFEDWVISEQEQLQQAALAAVYTLALWHAGQGHIDVSLEHSSRLLAMDNLSEKGQQLRMILLAQSGQRAAAMDQYHSFCRLLDEELDMVPLVETTTLYTAIKSSEFDPDEWQVGVGNASIAGQTPTATAVVRPIKQTQQIDWGEIPESASFYGRYAHLEQLQTWTSEGSGRVMQSLGWGG